jgi:hypothetical protein
MASRLGHVSAHKHAMLHKQYSCIGSPKHALPCYVCQMSRMKRLPFSDSMTKSNSVFDLIHLDIWGPMPQPSMDGDRYFLTIVDDYSRHT